MTRFPVTRVGSAFPVRRVGAASTAAITTSLVWLGLADPLEAEPRLFRNRKMRVTLGGQVEVPRGGIILKSPLARPTRAVAGDGRLVAPGSDEIRVDELPATVSIRY